MADIIQSFPAGAGSGHTILDTDGTAVAQEKNLQFSGLSVTDDSAQGVTEVAPASLNQDSLDDIAGTALPGTVLVGSGFNYSTSEQIIGRWIDGKPLYQKTIHETVPNTSSDGVHTTKEVALSTYGIINPETIWIDYGRSFKTTGSLQSEMIWSYNVSHANGNNLGTMIWLSVGNINIRNTRTDQNGADLYITILYTKTTN